MDYTGNKKRKKKNGGEVNNPVFPLVADVKQDMLETIVPKSENDSIMVVLGEHRGQVRIALIIIIIVPAA